MWTVLVNGEVLTTDVKEQHLNLEPTKTCRHQHVWKKQSELVASSSPDATFLATLSAHQHRANRMCVMLHKGSPVPRNSKASRPSRNVWNAVLFMYSHHECCTTSLMRRPIQRPHARTNVIDVPAAPSRFNGSAATDPAHVHDLAYNVSSARCFPALVGSPDVTNRRPSLDQPPSTSSRPLH